METESADNLVVKIEDLQNRLAEAEQLIEAIKAGEVDAFALNRNNQREIFTLQSGDYAYRVLVENFSEGALNLGEDGLIVYTNSYFHHLLNLSYEDVIGKSVFEFIHPNSREAFTWIFNKGLDGKSKGEINLIAGNKTIPVYISLTSLQPTLPTVGMIVTDLSEKKRHEQEVVKYQKDLEAKNLELVQSNVELDSFSYIASHDLQEPLRKIQAFSHLILDKSKAELTPLTKDYFNRIIAASNRMQKLISALLNYSRMNTSAIEFEMVDLNMAVEDAKKNIAELMEETNTTIETTPLPVLKVIPQQFSQLLINIFINAIKYRRPGVKPVIKIMADIIPAEEIPGLASPTAVRYYQVSISDNGIGFEQKYAEKIFELFQRLHGRSEYEGTGIGLAICRKIMQNHKGFIRAEGFPGAGSIFTFYLPIGH